MEFAFVLPILLYFVVGTMEFSIMFMAQNMLENAMTYAARAGKTGYAAAGMTRDQYLLMLAQSRVDRLMDPTQLSLNTESYSSLDKIGKPEPYVDRNGNGAYDLGETFTDVNSNGHWDADQGIDSEGNSGDVVVYTISYPWHMMTPFLSNILSNNGTVTLSSRLVVKNEPYNGG
ncbi:MAG TPA: TadE family protein [Alphaproteobacteria bacterium]|nr:TadE family protein [Alphaproteobacteria bacterium]